MATGSRWTGGCRAGRLAGGAVLFLALACPAGRADSDASSPLDRYKIHPVYNTTYDVLREQKTWKQKLNFDRHIVLADFKSQFDIMKKKDKRRNDYEQTQRKVSLDAERRRGGLRLYASADINRDRVDQTISSRQVDSDNVTLGGETTLLSHATNSLKCTLDGGVVRNHEVNIRRRTNGYTADSTDASGLRGGAGLSATLDRGEALSFKADLKLDAAQKESESIHEELTGTSRVTTPKKATDRDRNVTVSSTSQWTHFDEAKVQLQGSYGDATSQYYEASQQAQETRVTRRRDVSVLVEGDLTSTLYYSLNMGNKYTLLDYDLAARDRETRDSDLSTQAGYTIEHVPLLSGTDIVCGLSAGEGEVRVQTGNDYRTERAQVSGELTRPIGSRLTLSAKGEYQLIQDFYDDVTLDQDQVTERYNVGARYVPSDAFRSSVNYRIDNRETIMISSEVSSGNQEQEDYAVVAEYSATLPAAIQAKQSFQVQASYQSYVFTPEENSLARTNRLTTTLDVPLLEKTRVTLRHDFLKTDSGAYIYDDAGGGRAYARSIERLQQKLQTTVLHDLTPDIFIKVDERYELTYSHTLSTGARSRIDKLTFTWELGFDRQFPSGFQVSARAARTASTQEDDYWSIQADAGMRF